MTPLSQDRALLAEANRLLTMLHLPCYLLICPQEYWKHGDHHAYHKKLSNGKCAIIFNPHLKIRLSPEQTAQHVTLHEAAHHISKCECSDKHCTHWAKEMIRLYEITSTPLPRNSKFPTVRELLH